MYWIESRDSYEALPLVPRQQDSFQNKLGLALDARITYLVLWTSNSDGYRLSEAEQGSVTLSLYSLKQHDRKSGCIAPHI
jgi:hypothetical protein